MIRKLQERRAAIKARLEALNSATDATATTEARSFTEAESTEFDAGLAEIRQIDERIAELQEAEVREAAAAAHHVAITTPEERATASVSVTHEPNPVYRKGDASTSFFKDTAALMLNRNDISGTIGEARARLVASQETRAGDMTTVAGAGGQFAPPLWLVDEFVPLARPARVTADLFVSRELPRGVASVNLPKISGGSAVAVQATQNTAVQDTAMTTTSVSSGITTIAGKQIVSLQLLQQSGIPFDEVILSDLALAYAGQLDVQAISGSGASGQLRGLLNGAGVGTTSFTSASPAVTSATAANSFYNKLIAAINAVYVGRYLPPTAIVMHPQRWNWVLEGLDSQTRPLIVPNGPAFNGVGTDNGPTAQGATGTLLGLPVFVDPNVPTTNNTNQDIVFVLRKEDCYLWESPLQTASFDATYADQASILFRVLGYSALITDRFGPSVNAITGTGLLTPTL